MARLSTADLSKPEPAADYSGSTSEDWFGPQKGDRKTYIGGTHIAAILGLSRYQTPLEAYLQLIDRSAPTVMPEPMLWGRAVEPLIMLEFCQRAKLGLSQAQFVRSPRDHWRAGTPDGFASTITNRDPLIVSQDMATIHRPIGRRLLEAKSIGVSAKADWLRLGPPVEYLLQVQHYLDLTGLQLGTIVALFGGSELRAWNIPADGMLQQVIREACRWFWLQCIEPKIPPRDDDAARWRELAAPFFQQVEDDDEEAEAPPAQLPKDGVLSLRGIDDRLRWSLEAIADIREEMSTLKAAETQALEVVKGAVPSGCILVGDDGKPVVGWAKRSVKAQPAKPASERMQFEMVPYAKLREALDKATKKA